jgi:hypothetical protein
MQRIAPCVRQGLPRTRARAGMSVIGLRIRFSTRLSTSITRISWRSWSSRAVLFPCMCRGNSTTTSSAVAWNMAFYVCAARAVITSAWWLSVVPTVGALGERRGICPSCGARRMADDCMDAGGRAMQEQLPRVPRCWSVMSCPISQSASYRHGRRVVEQFRSNCRGC